MTLSAYTGYTGSSPWKVCCNYSDENNLLGKTDKLWPTNFHYFQSFNTNLVLLKVMKVCIGNLRKCQ